MLGAVAGSALGGIGADRFGRKRVFIADMAIIALACFIGAAAPNARFILLSQFLLGVGVGIDFPTSGAYVSELMPRASRNRMTVATIALQSVGMAAAALAGLAILKLRPSTEDWRLLFGAGRRDRAAFPSCAHMGAGKRALAGGEGADRRGDGAAQDIIDRVRREAREPSRRSGRPCGVEAGFRAAMRRTSAIRRCSAKPIAPARCSSPCPGC